MFKKILLISSLFSLILVNISLPLAVQAQESIIDPTSANYTNGNYSLDDIMIIVIKASRWVLGIVGSLSLIMFIYGGFVFLLSAGSSEKVGQAKKIIIAAVIGLIIVFTSYLIIRFVLTSLGMNWYGGTIIKSGQTCANFSDQGFSCMDYKKGTNCMIDYCPKSGTNIQCCQAATN